MMLKSRQGCKVGWEWYPTLKEARERSRSARAEAANLAAKGYDFGYCVPGFVRKCEDSTFCVTVP